MRRLLVLMIFATPAFSQFTGTAAHIRPVTSLPATCNPTSGDVVFLTTGGVGVYECLTKNTWSSSGGGGTAAGASGTFASTSSLIITPNLGTNNLIFQIFDSNGCLVGSQSSPCTAAAKLLGATISTGGIITAAFDTPMAGRWVVLSVGGSATVDTPVATPGQGTYAISVTVSLATITPGTTICYTTDGSTPTANTGGNCVHGTVYSGALTFTTTTTLKAVGALQSFNPSGLLSATYTITQPTLVTWNSIQVTFNGVNVSWN